METKKVKIPTTNLQIGMFVSRLDRPWLETPFLFQGFRIKNQKEIAGLQEYCDQVYIEVPVDPKARGLGARGGGEGAQALVPRTRLVVYQESTPVETEIAIAEKLHARVADLVHDLIQELRAGGDIAYPAVQRIISPMVDSVVRNPDAFLWLIELKRRDAYSYYRSLHSSVLAVVLGRHIGLPKADLHYLASGVLLMDIGKTKVQEQLLNKSERLTPQEFEQVKQHVHHGVLMLKETPGVEKQVIFIVRTHHERHDGSGYPFGLNALQIPLLGRIAGIVDCYGAITTDRPYAPAMSATQAMQALYEWRDIDFQAELVEQLIQALGIYPTGTLVELSSGEVGAVIAQNRLRRLRPKIMVVLDADKRPDPHFPIIDLIHATEDKMGNPLGISRALQPGAYGIDAKELYL